MKTLNKVTIKLIWLNDDEYMPPIEKMEENTFYISENYDLSIHKCLCGCGLKTVIPINSVHGWNLIKEDNGTISFTPSMLNPPPCNAHYIITKNVANILSFDFTEKNRTSAYLKGMICHNENGGDIYECSLYNPYNKETQEKEYEEFFKGFMNQRRESIKIDLNNSYPM